MSPRTPAEELLAGIWCELLHRDSVGVEESFFELGGHSLLATQMVSRLRRLFGVELPLRKVFELTSIAQLAAWVDTAVRERLGMAAPPLVAVPRSAPPPASFAQERLWFLDRFGVGGAAYHIPTALALSGPLDVAALAAALAEVVRRHEALRTTFAAAGEGVVEVIAPHLELALPLVDLSGLAATAPRAEPAHAAPAMGLNADLDFERRRLSAAEAERPFDLARGPLVRAALLRLRAQEHVLLLTLHHIVADGWSMGVLSTELSALYSAFCRGLPSPRPAGSAGRPAGSVGMAKAPADLPGVPAMATAPADLLGVPPIYPGGAANGGSAGLPELPLQYADFALWQRGYLQGEVLEAQLDYWRRQMAGAPALLALPLDRPRPAVQSFRGACRVAALPQPLSAAVKTLGRRHGASLFMTLLAAFEMLLLRYTGSADAPVGTPVANRTRLETEGIIGFFVNTLVLRTGLGGDPSFAELLGRIRETTLDAYAHQDIPFEQVVEGLRPQRDLSHAPLFQVMLILQDAAPRRLALAGLEARALAVESGTAKFDLTLAIADRGDHLTAELEYCRDLFAPETMARLLGHFENLLAGAAAEPARRLSELSLLSAADRHQIVLEWNDTPAPFPAHLCLHQLFEEQAARTPEALAVTTAESSWSYAELNLRANRLGHQLRRLGVGPGALVAVHLERGLEMAAAVLGVHKAGGAYVPIEINWPAERLCWILRRKAIAHLVTSTSRLAALAALPPLPDLAHVLTLDGDAAAAGTALEKRELRPGVALWTAAEMAGMASSNPAAGAAPEDLAYIIFTSGSTGEPKGVMVRHRAAVNLVHWVNQRFGVGPGDRLLFITALSFDLSVYDIFGILAAGGTVRVAAAAELRDPEGLVRTICREGITFWDSAPAALQQLATYFPPPAGLGGTGADGEAPALRLVFVSGDWISVTLPDRVRESFPRVRFVSLGGATEATVWSNYHPVGVVDPAWSSIPYGRPIGNARYHILDAQLGPCPIGVPGDLYITGDCLSSGYANEPELTAQKYVPAPFAGHPGERLYRTGDRARYWPDGTMEFLGRVDTQVKVRGFRIELGEIESVLAGHPAVREAVVLAREDTPGDQRLVAYFLAEGEPPPALELRRFVQARLPDYMVPAAFVRRQSWPLSPTGKLDRKALARATQQGRAEAGAEAGAQPPRTPLEKTIAAIWQEAIGLAAVGADDNFFDLGGHSLLMARVHARLEEALGRKLSLVDLFQYPTVHALAEHLRGGAGAAAVGEESEAARETRLGRMARGARTAAGAAGASVAIIGMAGRFPGAADLGEFWRKLRDGAEMIRFFSDEELLAAGFPAAVLADPQLVKARGALDGAELFDAAFFDYSPREAQLLDPQQRLFLETAWEAVEQAGYSGDTGSRRIGVYAGVSENTYLLELYARPELVRSVGRQQVSIANNHDYLPTRVSYKLDLRGPSINVQTACSTSLVAVHLACLSLLQGDCDIAVAGGASVQAHEVSAYLYEEGGISSPDGHTRAFDAAGAGMVSGSGVGVVVLKRLEDALADGDTVHAVVLGSASNNDGAFKVGFTAPSVEGQAAAIAGAHRAAGIDPATVRYVEAHGTGTAMGDPIEIAALNLAFAGAPAAEPISIGSVKTNIGHLDAASGVAGLLKTVLSLEHAAIPPSLHFSSPNPKVDFGRFRVNARLAEWPRGAAPRRAAVSSFGIGGTNAHLVLEEAPPAAPGSPSRPVQLLTLSAKTPAALAAVSARLADHLESHPALGARELADLAYTLHVGRKALRHRRMVVCRERDDALTALRGLDPRRAASAGAEAGAPAVAFLFPGQGAQHPRMGAELYAGEPAFRAALDQCCELLAPELGFDLREVLLPGERQGRKTGRRLERTAFTQPALFAVEYSLAQLWLAWGVRPAAMLGHSIGEYVAACLAGVFSLADGLRLVAARGRLMGELPPGAMLAVGLGEGEVAELLGGRLEIAAVNGAAATVVSGAEEAVAELAVRLRERGAEVRRLHTSHAFHSAAMEPILAPFEERLRRVALAPPRIPYVSNLTGTWISAGEATDPAYWARHLRHTVRFADGLGELLRLPAPALLEVGPGRTLTTLARQHGAKAAARLIVPSLGPARERGADIEHLLAALGRLWLAAAPVDWAAFHSHERRRRVPLPTYPFERRRFWLDEQPGRSAAERPAAGGAGTQPSAAAAAPVPSPPPEGWVAPEGEEERTVAAVFEEMLGLERAGRHDDFFECGGSSLMAVGLTSRLRQRLGIELPSSALLEASTVAALGELARQGRSGAGAGIGGVRPRPSCLVRLQAGAPGRRPLFLVHQVGGNVYTFRPLARALGAEVALYGLRSRGLEEGEEASAHIEEMAAHYLELVRGAQPAGPYRIGGASMGGMVAFEMAHQLRAAGCEVELLTLMDTPCLDQMGPPPTRDAEFVATLFLGRVELAAEELDPLGLDEQLAFAFAKAERAGAIADGFSPPEARRMLAVLRGNVSALYGYQPRPYEGSMLFFRAAQRRAYDPPRPELPWIELAHGGIEIHVVPGDHQTMHDPANVAAVSERLRPRLK